MITPIVPVLPETGISGVGCVVGRGVFVGAFATVRCVGVGVGPMVFVATGHMHVG